MRYDTPAQMLARDVQPHDMIQAGSATLETVVDIEQFGPSLSFYFESGRTVVMTEDVSLYASCPVW